MPELLLLVRCIKIAFYGVKCQGSLFNDFFFCNNDSNIELYIIIHILAPQDMILRYFWCVSRAFNIPITSHRSQTAKCGAKTNILILWQLQDLDGLGTSGRVSCVVNLRRSHWLTQNWVRYDSKVFRSKFLVSVTWPAFLQTAVSNWQQKWSFYCTYRHSIISRNQLGRSHSLWTCGPTPL